MNSVRVTGPVTSCQISNILKSADTIGLILKMERNIGFKERRYIEELRILTKATALDCVIDDRFDRVIYVIRQGDMGLAIGKKGENIKRLQNVLGKRIEMVEFAEKPDDFILNIFKPAEVTGIERGAEDGPVNVFVRQRERSGHRYRQGRL